MRILLKNNFWWPQQKVWCCQRVCYATLWWDDDFWQSLSCHKFLSRLLWSDPRLENLTHDMMLKLFKNCSCVNYCEHLNDFSRSMHPLMTDYLINHLWNSSWHHRNLYTCLYKIINSSFYWFFFEIFHNNFLLTHFHPLYPFAVVWLLHDEAEMSTLILQTNMNK